MHKVYCSHVCKKCLTKNFLFVEKAIIYFAKTQCPEVAKTTTRVRFTTCSLIGQIYSYMVFDWLTKMIFSHVKISYFLRVLKYDFSQWPETLYNTDVYEISTFIK